jgi:pyruvate,water dikinase
MTTNVPLLVRASSEITPIDRPLVGGKAVNLARLQGFGQPVPPWYAITTRSFQLALEIAGLNRRIVTRLGEVADQDEDARRSAAREIQQWIRRFEIPQDLRVAIAQAHERHIPVGSFSAVRSSAVEEDSTADSFAGAHDSYLFVQGHGDILEAVKKVWASAYNERALSYRRARGMRWGEVAVGVVVQQMVNPEVSGVMFTVNPNTGDVYEVVISAVYGAGEGLVSAGFDADMFIVDKEALEIRSNVVPKQEQLVFDDRAGSGLKRVAVSDGRQRESSLTRDQILAVARTGLVIERSFRCPQDVEFCLDADGRLYILQARPITTVRGYGQAAGNRLIWDNSNIIESYSGVTTPMTFSFIRRAYTIVYHCFAEIMGIDAETVRRNRHTFENMLGLFGGQVYYNLINWYQLIRLFPGYRYNKQFMESMMGVRDTSRLDEDNSPPPGWCQRCFVELPALLRLLLRSAHNFIRIRQIVSEFERDFKELYGRWSSLDFHSMAPHELMALYREMEEKLLWNWKAPIINDFFVMISYGTLKRLCISYCGDSLGSLQNDLVCGEGGIESTAPTKMLLSLAWEARKNPALRELILMESPEKLAEEIPSDPRFVDFSESVRRYLDLYGFRCVNELKLEEYSLKDRPAFLYKMIRNYLTLEEQQRQDVEGAEERERRIRAEAEQRAFRAIRQSRSLVPRRLIFKWVLANARLGVKNRENMRFARTRIYGLLRELIRALGDNLAREGILDHRDDIFYLTLDEVWDFIKGTAVTTNLRGLVEVRRQEFDVYRTDKEQLPDDRFETFGMAYVRNRFKGRGEASVRAEDGVLRGIGCCPGVVTGPVKVIRSPSEDATLSGEILVAERTDPGWVPLYPSVSGILIERGSILSHSAIVAREMGIPTIVGIRGLTSFLRSGQRVTMDGAAGTVRLEPGKLNSGSRQE